MYPREVEDALRAHPGVADAAVVGTPIAEWGEIVTAYLEGRASPDARRAARSWPTASRPTSSRGSSTRSSALPRNALGKVQKHLLGG